MSSPLVDLGTGAAVVFGTSGFTAQLLEITPYEMSRGSVETTYLGSTESATDFGGRSFIPEDLTDMGEMSIKGHFNPDTLPPIKGAVETITITFPSTATAAFSGFMTSYKPGAMVTNEKMTFDATIKITGAVNITAAV